MGRIPLSAFGFFRPGIVEDSNHDISVVKEDLSRSRQTREIAIAAALGCRRPHRDPTSMILEVDPAAELNSWARIPVNSWARIPVNFRGYVYHGQPETPVAPSQNQACNRDWQPV